MKVLVGIKRVVDYHVRIQVKQDGSGVNTDGVKMSMNPFDEIAIEEAIRLKEAGTASEVVVVTIGAKVCQEQLRTALAMGADKAIHVETDDEVQPLTAARVLAEIVNREQPSLVLAGKLSIDDDNGQTPQMLAGLLGWPQACFASEITVDGESLVVKREVDAGIESIKVTLPAVVSADLRLNEPRYVKLPDIMKAKRKPLENIPFADLNIEASAQVATLKTSAPATRAAGVKVETVEEIVTLLKERGVL